MPALSRRMVEAGVSALRARELVQTVGQSGMTPTTFSFLIPVFVVALIAPVLCVLYVRKRNHAQPPVPAVMKKPALQRAEARAILNSVTAISNVTSEPRAARNATIEENELAAESVSLSERECAICLSTLHAPSLPEPARLSNEPVTDRAARPLSIKDASIAAPEAILKLHVCGHEFHAECLVSWFVLRKTSCPICRAVYYSKEAMQSHDEEAQLATAAMQMPAETQASTLIALNRL